MKKIINGKKYDTETAKALGKWTAPDKIETLYLKKTGEFFYTCTLQGADTVSAPRRRF